MLCCFECFGKSNNILLKEPSYTILTTSKIDKLVRIATKHPKLCKNYHSKVPYLRILADFDSICCLIIVVYDFDVLSYAYSTSNPFLCVCRYHWELLWQKNESYIWDLLFFKPA